jgi:hypothetical protein
MMMKSTEKTQNRRLDRIQRISKCLVRTKARMFSIKKTRTIANEMGRLFFSFSRSFSTSFQYEVS